MGVVLLEFRHVASFLVLAEELHFGRAAARLHLAQPSLSEQLQRLERRIGVQLVARTSHRVWLTPAGEAFQREARRLLNQLDLAVEAARQAGAGLRGRVRIGFNYPAGQQILTPTLAILSERHPEVATSLVARHTLGQLAALRADQIDVAFVYGALRERGLCQRPIMTLPVVGLCANRHPLASRGPVRWAELAEHRCILPSRSTSPAMYDAVVAAARLNGIDLSTADTFDDGDAAAVMVASQEVVIFASRTRAEAVASAGVSTVPLIDPVPQVTVHAVWRDEEVNPAVPIFLDALQEAEPRYSTDRR